MGRRRKAEGTLPLFADGGENAPPGYPERNRERLRRWASAGIRFGTSSWKYPGWKGLVYRGSYPTKKEFERECLTEYSELFPTVCADFALYDFPDPETMHVMHEQTVDDFRISLKVTDRITVKRYPRLARHGANAGKENPDFLNVELFEDAFLTPIERLGKKRGIIIFEFSTFFPDSGVAYDDYVRLLDEFLSRLPKGFDYAVELRNREFLTPDYLQMLAEHGTAHVLNSWTRMPPVIEQLQIGGILTAGFSVARALLKPGRTYQEAVERFQPYQEIREENPELRIGLAEAVRRCVAEKRSLYAYVNNRAEGNSPKTIEAILDILDQYPVETL
jgi:uncharacterized protein YecE (DUF72 family)